MKTSRRDALKVGLAAAAGLPAWGLDIRSLKSSIEGAGLAAHLLGDRVLVMPYGARIIGLYPRPEWNALWVNPVLMKPESLARVMAQPGWLNLGGDRTWISPEVEVNIGDPARMWDTYDCPKGVDPGAYYVTGARPDSISLATQMDIQFLRSKRRIKIHLTKTIRLLQEPSFPVTGAAAGYELRTRIEAPGLPAGVRPAIWNLLQAPGGGSFRVPVKGGPLPRTFFGKPIYDRQGQTLRCPVKNPMASKLGIHADASKGILIYSGMASKPYSLVRRFHVSASREYSDVPCDDLKATGYMTQLYVDDGKLGGFGEMEYHSPALDSAAGRTSIEDLSETWAFEGQAGGLE